MSEKAHRHAERRRHPQPDLRLHAKAPRRQAGRYSAQTSDMPDTGQSGKNLSEQDKTYSSRDRLKRVSDIVGSLAGIVLLFPLMALISILVKANTAGPVIFRQPCKGRNGETFILFKFRTLHAAACDPRGAQVLELDDKRITAIGHFLRQSNLDELPQLFNVLKGEMSLVGPRPHMLEATVAGVDLQTLDPSYARRTLVRPGIAGLANVNGIKGYPRTLEDARTGLKYDLEYIKTRSLRLDLQILAQTIKQEFLGGSG